VSVPGVGAREDVASGPSAIFQRRVLGSQGPCRISLFLFLVIVTCSSSKMAVHPWSQRTGMESNGSRNNGSRWVVVAEGGRLPMGSWPM
jgi:hypothetical protein